LIVSVVVAVLSVPAISAAGRQGGEKVILDARRSYWRFRIVWQTEEVILEPGKVDHVLFKFDRQWFYRHPKQIAVDKYTVEKVPMVRLPATTSPEWMKNDFDDSTWMRCHGPMLDKSRNENWKLVLMRGRFEVPDPAKAGDLTLSLTFRGGAVVYLNGQELTRAFMPRGKIDLYTPAEAYPTEVYLDDRGYVTWPYDDKEVYLDRFKKRIRRIADFVIPASKLRKGVNVLAVAIHRAPTDPVIFLRRIVRYPLSAYSDHRMQWCRTGLLDIRLTAPADSAVPANVARTPGKGFLAWNQSILRKVFTSDYPDPFTPLQPVRLTGARGGTFAGQVVVGHDRPIKGLRTEVSGLRGPGRIPASAVRVRYAVPDGPALKRGGPRAFDSLEESPPAVVPVYSAGGGAIQPLWITVTIPPDAPAGDYTGKIVVRADGLKSIVVPLEVRVIDWAMPDAKSFTVRMDVVESPESVAMAYGVPMWSEAHLKLLDKVFSLLAPLSVRTLYITCVRRTHFGNEHAMVRWIRRPDGQLEPDLSVVEKYLDVAVKHLGAIPGVILYCWEPSRSMGHAGGAGGPGRTNDKPILLTFVDPKTGRLKRRKGPAWGTPESRQLWTKLVKAMRPVLARRGLADSMLFGLIGDNRPTKQAMDDIAAAAPDAKWAAHSHYYVTKWRGYEVGMATSLWGIGCVPVDPAQGRGYGWRNPFWLNYYPREVSPLSPLVDYRTKIENWMGARSRSLKKYSKARGARGLGRLGADFWKVLKDSRGARVASLAGRYPESYWGQLNLNYGVPNLLGMGKDGPVATVRSEAFRENIQEMEARIFIERALLDKAKRAVLGDDLARRCREALDERIRLALHAPGEGMVWFVSSDWNRRTERLFRLAAEVAKQLGK